MPSGQPMRFYWDGFMVGLVPAPANTTSGGYPNVQFGINCEVPLTDANPAVAITDWIPQIFRSYMIFVQGARMYYAQAFKKEDFQLYATLYQQELSDAERFLGKRTRNYFSQAYPESHTSGVI